MPARQPHDYDDSRNSYGKNRFLHDSLITMLASA